MSGEIREYLRRNVLGLVAIFIALNGTAIGLSGKNSVQSNDIGPGEQVKNKDTTPVTGDWIADGSLELDDLGANSVNSSKIADGGIGANDLAGNSVNAAKVVDNSLTAAEIADTSSLTTSEIDESLLPVGGDLTGTVANAQIGANAVTTAEVANNSLSQADLGAVTTSRSFDYQSIAAQTCIAVQAGITGVTAGEAVFLIPVDGVVGSGGLVLMPSIGTAPDVANWALCNITGAAIDPPSENYRIFTVNP